MADQEPQEHNLPYKACVAVGSQYAGKGQYENALRMFEKAADQPEFDNSCRVARAQTYLKMGKAKEALEEAQEALSKDAKCIKAILMKAEALYATGEFEWAMMAFHQGLHRRPEIADFQRGVDKCTEAIENGVKTIGQIKMKSAVNTAFLKEDTVAQLKKKATKKQASPAQFVGAMAQKMQLMDRKKKPEKRVKESPRTVRQLLGDLYQDKAYLERLLGEDSKPSSEKEEVKNLAKGGVDFLEKQTDFWRRQQPIYARKSDSERRRKKKAPELTTNQLTQKYLELLVEIDTALLDGKSPEALHKCEQWLARISKHSSYELPSKQEILANLHSSYGNALLDMGRLDEALVSHQTDMEYSTQIRNADGMSRAMDNVGRTFAKLGRHREAIEVFQSKADGVDRHGEQAWLDHETGRSYFQLLEYDSAAKYARRTQEAAVAGLDEVWMLNGKVLEAQCYSKMDDPIHGRNLFVEALGLAMKVGEETSVDAITLAIDELEERLTMLGFQPPFPEKDYSELANMQGGDEVLPESVPSDPDLAKEAAGGEAEPVGVDVGEEKPLPTEEGAAQQTESVETEKSPADNVPSSGNRATSLPIGASAFSPDGVVLSPKS